ncbi:MAG: preprotein translocase subunit SecD [Phenylobacterium sp.]|jgi:preprotein translocase subunit SecD
MKTHHKPVNRYAKWQYLVLIVTIIILTISALPNLYGEQAAIYIRPVQSTGQSTGQPTEQLNQATLYADLKQQGFAVKHINTTAQDSKSKSSTSANTHKTTILLQSNQQQAPAQQYLKTKLGPDYIVAMAMEPASPQWLTDINMAPIKLGLDLRGGVRFLLDVDTQVAITEHLQQIQHEISQQARTARIYGVKARVSGQDKVVVDYRSSAAGLADIKREMTRRYPDLVLKNDSATRFSLHFSEQARHQFEQKIIQQNLHTLRGRIEEMGITEAATQRQGKNRIRIELPGVQDPTEARRLIGATASLDFYQLAADGKSASKSFKTEDGRTLKLDPNPILSGKHIKDARAGVGELGTAEVRLVLDSVGGQKMTKHSRQNMNQAMVTVFSEFYQNEQGKSVKKSKVINVANIVSVLGSRFNITNMQSLQSASELSLLLRAGSLTAPVTIVAQSTIGPSLGQDNIYNGMAALMLGLGIILAFMTLWYRRLGLVANTALLINLVCLMGLMSLIPGAVLTLPGIAGLVLTVGMAVDTNVLIFERIKEEKRRGRSLAMAVEHGYNNAFATILDANITTMITAVILYSVGYGPVKGFAITLGLGLLTSMFTGVFASRAMVNLWLGLSNKNGKDGKNSKLLKGVVS